MARRYAGDVTLYVELPISGAGTVPHLEQECYHVRAVRNRLRIGETTVGRTPSELRADDNPAVIDEVALSALRFMVNDGADIEADEISRSRNAQHITG